MITLTIEAKDRIALEKELQKEYLDSVRQNAISKYVANRLR